MKSLEFGVCEKASTDQAKHEAFFRFSSIFLSDLSFLCYAHLSLNRSLSTLTCLQSQSCLLLHKLLLVSVTLPPFVWLRLSTNTCCQRSAALLSGDAGSSPPSPLTFHPAFLSFLLSFYMSSYLSFFIQACFFSPIPLFFFVLFFLHQIEDKSSSPGSSFICFLSPPLNIWSLTDCDARSVLRADFHSRRKMIWHDACTEAVREKKEPYLSGDVKSLGARTKFSSIQQLFFFSPS